LINCLGAAGMERLADMAEILVLSRFQKSVSFENASYNYKNR